MNKEGKSLIFVAVFLILLALIMVPLILSVPSNVSTTCYNEKHSVINHEITCEVENTLQSGLNHKVGIDLNLISGKKAKDVEIYEFVEKTKEVPVYETICDPYDEELTNGSKAHYENCEQSQTGTKTVYYEDLEKLTVKPNSNKVKWEAEESQFQSQEKKKFLIKWKTPIERIGNGWGSKGNWKINPEDWWDDSWTRRRNIVIDHDKINGDLQDFTVTVFLDGSNFGFSDAKSDGTDIRFVNASHNEEFDYEIEKWDSANEEAIIYVKIPFISSALNTTFYIYYDNPSAPDNQDSVNTWDDNFFGVWHLNNTLDSKRTYNGTTGGNVIKTEGQIDGAYEFDGDNDYIDLANLEGQFNLSNRDYTISAWINGSYSDSAHHVIVSGWPVAGSQGWYFEVEDRYLSIEHHDGGGQGDVDSNVQLPYYQQDFIYAVMTFTNSNNNVAFYINNASVGGGTHSKEVMDNVGEARTVGVFAQDHNWGDYKGIIDELRVSKTVRSQAWLKAEYYSGVNLLLAPGEEEEAVIDSIPPYWSNNKTDASDLTKKGDSVYFNITLEDDFGGGNYIFSFDDGTSNFFNNTPVPWTTPEEVQIIKIITATKGQPVRWRWHFNDAAGNWNQTPIWDFTVANSLPIQTTPLLTSTFGTNFRNENLTCYNQSTSDSDNDPVINIYNWYKNSGPLLALNLPLEINADDYSGYSNDGTINGASFVNGKVGKALEFDGADNVSITDANSLDFTDKKTWQIWFKRDTTGAETLFNKGDETYTNYKLEFLSNNKLKFSYSITPGEAGYEWEIKEKADFDEGAYTQTYYNTTYNAVMLSSSYEGDYKSKIFSNSGKTLSFDTISWKAEVPTVEELTPEANMVGLWHLNEGSGNITYDETANDNDGIIYGASWIGGKFNYALDFDGVNDYVEINSTFNSDNLSILAWIKAPEDTGNRDIISLGAWSSVNEERDLSAVMRIEDQNSGLEVVITNTGDHTVTKGYRGLNALDDNIWHQVGFSFKDEILKLYVDGQNISVEKQSDDSFTSIHDSSNPTTFGMLKSITGSNIYFHGTIDEVAIYNKGLSASEIQNHYEKGVGTVTNLSLSARSCDDPNCNGEGWVDIGDTPPVNLSGVVNDNTYFQFKGDFLTNNTDYSPKLYNVTVDYSAQITADEANITSTTAITDSEWYLATVTFDEIPATNNFKLYLDNSLETTKTESSPPSAKDNNLVIGQNFDGALDEFKIYQEALTLQQIQAHYALKYDKVVSQETSGGDTYMCQVTPNDGEDDGTTLSSSSLEVLWAITFNVTSGEDGSQISNFAISCDNDWSVSWVSSPYTAGFAPWNYECEFAKPSWYNGTVEFTADNDKRVDVKMSRQAYLTIEEHTWLEWLYNCWHNGDCWNLLSRVNQTTTQTWQRLTGTNRNVITQEDILSNTLSAESNISINYTIEVPYKEGVPLNDLLPIRLYFWFTDTEKTQCHSQDKGTNTNRAEQPYCLPLVAEILGPNNGTVTFRADLRPALSAGTYGFIRSIEIDPLGVWTQYGRGYLGKIEVSESGDAGIGISNENRINFETGKKSSGVITSESQPTTIPQERGEDKEETGVAIPAPSITGGAIGVVKEPAFIMGMVVAFLIVSVIINIIFVLNKNKAKGKKR